MRVIELSNSSHWQDIFFTDVVAVQVPMQNGKSLLNPIPEIIIPLLLDKFIVAVDVSTDVPQNSVWNFAGYASQQINTGLVIGGSQDATHVSRRSLYLNQINLIFFQKISSVYSLSIKVPKWFPRARVAVWVYTGPDNSSEEILLNRLEAKIDDISSYG